ncbi:MAG: ArsC/Spx/MgsR family protein [Pseudomonadota bacterium]
MQKSAILYGIKACDTCRLARRTLEKEGYSLTFIDVRDTPLAKSKIEDFLAQFGDALLNKRSTTWRGLSEDERAKPPLSLLTEHPTLMKRPVIEAVTTTLGWDAAAKSAHLG